MNYIMSEDPRAISASGEPMSFFEKLGINPTSHQDKLIIISLFGGLVFMRNIEKQLQAISQIKGLSHLYCERNNYIKALAIAKQCWHLKFAVNNLYKTK